MKGKILYFLFILLCFIFPLTLSLGNSLLITYTPSTFHNLLFQNNNILLSSSDRKNLAVTLFQGITQQKSIQTVLGSGVNAFSEKEIVHMLDVAHLIKFLTFLFVILLISSIFLILYLRRKKYQLIRHLPIVSIFLSMAMLVIILLRFDQMFTLFHKITFRNDFWLLDPNKDLLINLFPLSFFVIQFAKICIMALLELALLFFGLRVIKK